MSEMTYGHVANEDQMELLRVELMLDEESELRRVDTQKVHSFMVSGEFYYDPHNQLLISFGAHSAKVMDRLIYYVGGENEAELSLFSRNHRILVFKFEDNERFGNKLVGKSVIEEDEEEDNW